MQNVKTRIVYNANTCSLLDKQMQSTLRALDYEVSTVGDKTSTAVRAARFKRIVSSYEYEYV